jgi:hypothetical protein
VSLLSICLLKGEIVSKILESLKYPKARLETFISGTSDSCGNKTTSSQRLLTSEEAGKCDPQRGEKSVNRID